MPRPKAEIWGPNMQLTPPPPPSPLNKLVKRRFMYIAMTTLLQIIFVLCIHINVCQFNEQQS